MYGNENRRGFSQRTPPVAVGDELDVRIDAVGEKGDGLAKKDGFVLIVPGAKANEEVRIKVTRVLRQVGFAEVVGKAQGPIADEKPQRDQERVREARPAKPKEEEFKYDESKDSESFGDESASEEEQTEENSEDEETQESDNLEESTDAEDLTSDPEEVLEENSDDEDKKEKL